MKIVPRLVERNPPLKQFYEVVWPNENFRPIVLTFLGILEVYGRTIRSAVLRRGKLPSYILWVTFELSERTFCFKYNRRGYITMHEDQVDAKIFAKITHKMTSDELIGLFFEL
jgi:hypothetical protein